MEARAELTSAQSRIEQASSALASCHSYRKTFHKVTVIPTIMTLKIFYPVFVVKWIYLLQGYWGGCRRSSQKPNIIIIKWKKQKRKQFLFCFIISWCTQEKQSYCGTWTEPFRHNAILNDLNTISIHDTGRSLSLFRPKPEGWWFSR